MKKLIILIIVFIIILCNIDNSYLSLTFLSIGLLCILMYVIKKFGNNY
jgi:hypothetical protein